MARNSMSDLVDAVAEKTGETKKDTKLILETAFAEIKDGVLAGDEFALNGFGIFSLKQLAARTGRNPATGESIEIAASSKLHFKPTKSSK